MTAHRAARRHTAFAAIIALITITASCGSSHANRIVIGSKNFTESLMLGELLAQLIESRTDLKVERRFYLAGTYICQQAMLAGRIDLYPEYTGTALTAILKQDVSAGQNDKNKIYQEVKNQYESRFKFTLSPPFGFNDTFAMEIRGEDARRLHLTTLSQSAQYSPQWHAGFGYEFSERPDGYPGMARVYGLRFATPPRIMDLGLLAPALKNHQIDMAAGNATDGLIMAFDFFVLADDRHYFPPYEAVAVIRQQTAQEHPEIAAAVAALADKISDQEMQKLNYALDGQHRDAQEVAREFLKGKGLIP